MAVHYLIQKEKCCWTGKSKNIIALSKKLVEENVFEHLNTNIRIDYGTRFNNITEGRIALNNNQRTRVFFGKLADRLTNIHDIIALGVFFVFRDCILEFAEERLNDKGYKA